MTITFESYQDIDRLQQLCIFAQHDQAQIAAMAQSVRPEYADKMRAENHAWFEMRRKLAEAKPNEPIKL